MEPPENIFAYFFALAKEVLITFANAGGIIILGGSFIFFLVWFFVLRKRKHVSSIEKLKKKHMEIAKREKQAAYPYLKKLCRANFDISRIPESIVGEDLKEALANNDNIYMGEITGFNVVDINVAAADVIRHNKKGAKGGSEKVREDMIEQATADAEIIGNQMYVIAYKQKAGMFKTKENLLMVFEPQMISYNDPLGGVVTVAGYGIDQFGEFDFLTGNPRLIPFIINYLKKMSDIDTITGVMGDQRNIVNKAIDLDSNQTKAERMMAAAGNIMNQKRDKKE